MQDLLPFIAISSGVIGQGLDVITTNAGLTQHAKETNSFVANVIAKFGFPVFAFIKVGGLAIGLPVLFYSIPAIGPVGAEVAGFAAAVAGFTAGIINYRRLKAAKLSVF